jgi:hypothetical protein
MNHTSDKLRRAVPLPRRFGRAEQDELAAQVLPRFAVVAVAAETIGFGCRHEGLFFLSVDGCVRGQPRQPKLT